MDFKEFIKDIPDFPQKGILFRDITPLLQNGPVYHACVDELCAFAKAVKADVIVGPEARGFLFGCTVAYGLNIGFVPIRKPGKLPRETISESYDLEYGSNVLHIHADALKPGDRVVLVDDLLATGGTAKAALDLVTKAGGVVAGAAFVVELSDLKGRELLKNYTVKTLVTY